MRKLFIILFLLIPTILFADECPDGYSYLDDSGLCKIQCNAGTYVNTVGGECVPVTLRKQYVDTTHIVTYGETTPDEYIKTCPEPEIRDYYNGSISIPDAYDKNGHNSIGLCILSGVRGRYTQDLSNCGNEYCVVNRTATTNGVFIAPCYYLSGTDGNAVYGASATTGRGCVGGTTIKSCDAGFYTPRQSISNLGPFNFVCFPVDTGFYSPDGDLNRYECPAGTATCGYGDCAKSIDDCRPIHNLKTSNGINIVLSSDKRSTPSLVAQTPDGNLWYGELVLGNKSGFINMLHNGKNYYLANPLDKFTKYTFTYGGVTYVNYRIPDN